MSGLGFDHSCVKGIGIFSIIKVNRSKPGTTNDWTETPRLQAQNRETALDGFSDEMQRSYRKDRSPSQWEPSDQKTKRSASPPLHHLISILAVIFSECAAEILHRFLASYR